MAEQCLVAGTASSVAMLKTVDAPDWLDALGLPWLSVHTDGRLGGSVSTTVAASSDGAGGGVVP